MSTMRSHSASACSTIGAGAASDALLGPGLLLLASSPEEDTTRTVPTYIEGTVRSDVASAETSVWVIAETEKLPTP